MSNQWAQLSVDMTGKPIIENKNLPKKKYEKKGRKEEGEKQKNKRHLVAVRFNSIEKF